MIVVGGCYREVCNEPVLNWTYGSGVRAAAILGDAAERLVTVADEECLLEARAVLGSVSVNAQPRAFPISFLYDTPLSLPRVEGALASSDKHALAVTTDAVLVFGMIDATFSLAARHCVVDPQHSMDLSDIVAIRTDQLVVVANVREVRALTDSDDVELAVERLFQGTSAELVVVKGGALGALVFRRGERPVGVAPCVTETVFPIGSGDVFSAAFADAYLSGTDPVRAAERACERTAEYVATRQTARADVLWRRGRAPSPATLRDPPLVYVAASFEIPEQRWSARTLATGIRDIGGTPIYPLQDIGPKTDAKITATADLEAMDSCQAVALLADVARIGPYFEAGWATSHATPVVVISDDRDPDRFTMLRGTGATICHDLSTGAYQAVWRAVEHRHGQEGDGRLLLLSGGLDSSSIAAIERPDRALFVDYGQRPAAGEWSAAQRIAEHLKIPLDSITVDLAQLGSGLLVGDETKSDAPSPEWFPFRNQLLTTIAAAEALRGGERTVILGLVGRDGDRHADGSSRFVARVDATTQLQEGGVRVVAPFVRTDPIDVLRAGALPADLLQETFSCHRGPKACGECPGCDRRAALLGTL